MGEKRYVGAGKVVWHELLTADVGKSTSYYRELFGWTFRDVYRGREEMYKTIAVAGEDIGGIVPLDPSAGSTSHWLPYVTVESVEAAVVNAPRLRGNAKVAATDVPGFGRCAVIEDPSGGRVSPFQGGDPDEDQYEGPPRPGTFIWDELLSRDPEGAGKFYCGVFGWNLFKMDLGSEGTYYLFRRGERDEGGMILKPSQAEGPSAWLPYVAVENVDLAAARAATLGGAIFRAPSDLHGAGRFAIIGDPTGAFLALFHPAAGRGEPGPGE